MNKAETKVQEATELEHNSIVVSEKLISDNIFIFNYSLNELARRRIKRNNDSLFMPHRANINEKPSPVCIRMSFDKWFFEERDNLK